MNKYWFRKRRGLFSKDLGWGWIPISWEGWTLIGIYCIAVVAAGAIEGIYNSSASLSSGLWFLVDILFLTLLLAVVSAKKCRP